MILIRDPELDESTALGCQTKESVIYKAIREFNDRDFDKFVWNHYMLRDSEFIQYDINC